MTRSALQTQMGAASVVDAAAIIGNFERMDRIADGTGIPLDTPVAAMTADLREDLGLNEFGSAANTPAVGRFLAGMGRLMRPIMRRLAPTLFRQ